MTLRELREVARRHGVPYSGKTKDELYRALYRALRSPKANARQRRRIRTMLGR